jgi:hypothetical protein
MMAALKTPVAEGVPVGLSDRGNRRDWFPGAGGRKAVFIPVFSQRSPEPEKCVNSLGFQIFT